MSTNTENFKTEQKAKWADGKRANGANFAQLFDAIARLIEISIRAPVWGAIAHFIWD